MNGFRNRVLAVASAIAVLAFPTFADTYNMTGTVTSVTPNYRNITVPVTVQDCRNVEVPVYGTAQGNGNAVEGAIAGAIIGGILGEAIGGKNERNVGAVFGAIVGGDKAANGNRRVVTGYRTERQCTDQTVNELRRELTDYTVTYEILGVQQTAKVTRAYRVGDAIPVQVVIGLR